MLLKRNGAVLVIPWNPSFEQLVVVNAALVAPPYQLLLPLTWKRFVYPTLGKKRKKPTLKTSCQCTTWHTKTETLKQT